MSREKVPKYIFEFMPVLHRKLIKSRPQTDLPRVSMSLLNTLNFHDGEPMSFYCDKMFISKPNMTKLVRGLIEDGYVKREHDEADRRIVRIHLTDQGRIKINEQMDSLKAQILESISGLSDEEVQSLVDSFETIRQIFDKLEDYERDTEE